MILQSGSGLKNRAAVQFENVAPVFPLVLLINYTWLWSVMMAQSYHFLLSHREEK